MKSRREKNPKHPKRPNQHNKARSRERKLQKVQWRCSTLETTMHEQPRVVGKDDNNKFWSVGVSVSGLRWWRSRQHCCCLIEMGKTVWWSVETKALATMMALDDDKCGCSGQGWQNFFQRTLCSRYHVQYSEKYVWD